MTRNNSKTGERESGDVDSAKLTAQQFDRRTFLKAAGSIAFLAPTLGLVADKSVAMGIVVHSYAGRWNSKAPSQKYPGFANAVDLIEHCHEIGAGGVQVGVGGWTGDFALRVRDRREKLGLYLEGSIGLPKSESEIVRFEQEVKSSREAGATVLRTVCLGGRRYEAFHSAEEFAAFRKNAVKSLQLAEAIVRKHRMKLAVENHKDWRAKELVEVLKTLDSEWVGVTLDFGNSIALMEDPMEVASILLPYLVTTHVKDMAVEEYDEGFRLSEVPLGTGLIDLPTLFSDCSGQNPKVTFNLEMITRDPLNIPCLREDYWATFGQVSGAELAHTLRMVKEKKYRDSLPRVSQLNQEDRLATEEQNILSSLKYSRDRLGLP